MNELDINKVYCEDCIGQKGMCLIPDKSIDMILCDLPYGTIACKWDVIIPFESLWKQYERIIKDNGAIVLTASQPFTTDLINSNRKMFKYCWYWNKDKGGNFATAKYQPLRVVEDILIFCKHKTPYNAQMVLAKDENKRPRNGVVNEKADTTHGIASGIFKTSVNHNEELRFPKNIINIKSTENECNQSNRVHPTQKPAALFEYLIRTYTEEGEIVLDNCMGSGTTAIGCINTNRNYIGFEKEEKYFNIIQERIRNHTVKPNTINIISKEPSLFDIL